MNFHNPHKQPDRQINIAFFENGIGLGGAVTCLAALIRSLDPARFRAIVLSSHDDAPTRRVIEDAGAEFLLVRQYRRSERLEALSRTFGGNNPLRYPLLLLILCYESLRRLWYGFRAWRVLARHQVNLVHLNNSLAGNLEGILAAKLQRVKCVQHLRGYEYNSLESRLAARWVTCFIAVSKSVADSLIPLGVPRERIRVIYDGIDFEESVAKSVEPLAAGTFESDNFKIGLVGSLIPWKGQRVFVEAAAILINDMKMRDTRFFLIGDTVPGGEDYRRELEQLAAAANISDHLVFVGHQDNVYKFLTRLDLVVHASILPEPFGRVIIEAMALARPVIATSMGGPLEIIEHGRDGLLVRAGDPRSLAESVYELLTNSDQRRLMASAAKRKVATQFTLSRFAQELELLYASLN
ncbi:MAG: glycosyltransferase [Blastocatellia bacterium]